MEKTLRETSFAEGIAEGKAEGIAEGKAEEMKTIAKNMRAEGLSLELIAKCTNLTLDEISQL